jgi:(p)ppGpp synthase/HD superfamily hydrolase
MVTRILNAAEFAAQAHNTQRRKFFDEPYIAHVLRVAETVSVVTNDEAAIMAALLHDTVEDTHITIEDIQAKFAWPVADWVAALTDYDYRDYGRTHSYANRLQRKIADAQRLADAPEEVQTIKCADLIDNTRTIVEHDPDFAVTYLKEKAYLLPKLTKANKILWNEANQILRDSQLRLTVYNNLVVPTA